MKKKATLTKTMVKDMLQTADGWEVGGSVEFSYRYPYSNGVWNFKVERCEAKYAPGKFSLCGRKQERTVVGTYATWGRRYKTIEQLLLHIANRLNENVNVANRYKTVAEWMSDDDGWC